MSKKLNEDLMKSELSGSAFFQRPEIPSVADKKGTSISKNVEVVAALPTSKPSPVTQKAPTPTRTVEPTNQPTVARTDAFTYGRTDGRRTITRYAFEFFQDQIETLKRLSLEQQLRGEKGSMSEMVREAMDAYISRTLNQLNEETDGR